MNKVHFRARTVDANKPMPIYRHGQIPEEYPDFEKINRAVVQMPTGMEKEEEAETHLQKALTAQQFFGTAEKRAIPIPEVQPVNERYEELYAADYKPTKQYIHVEALGMEHELPDYDMDSEDEDWLNGQSKKMDIGCLKFEEMMDRLEKGSGQQVVNLQAAKLLLKEDDDLTIAVYDYWLNKRLKFEKPLTYQIKPEKRDGTTNNDPYVPFRRRMEKMQTRKNRKNDEVSYEKMLKLKRDMGKVSALLESVKRREKSKKEQLQLNLEILQKRFELNDYSGSILAEAEAEQAKMPMFVPPYMLDSRGLTVPTVNGEEAPPVRKKRAYRRRQKLAEESAEVHFRRACEVAMLDRDTDPSSPFRDGMFDFSPPGLSPSEDENDPDGPYAFKRRRLCNYHAPVLNEQGDWPWANPKEGGTGGKQHRYSLTAFPNGHGSGFSRRRLGRGGRVIIDRGFSPWNEDLEKIDLAAGESFSGQLGEYHTHIRESRVPYYTPQGQSSEDEETDEDQSSSFTWSNSSRESDPIRKRSLQPCSRFSPNKRKHQKAGVSQPPSLSSSNFVGHHDSYLHRSFSSQPTSCFTLDSASAEFAVTALIKPPPLNHTTARKKEEVVVVAAEGKKEGEVTGSPRVGVVSEQPGVFSSSNSVSIPPATATGCAPLVSLLHPSETAASASTAAINVQSRNSVSSSSACVSLLSMPSLLSSSSSSSPSTRPTQLQRAAVRPNGPLILQQSFIPAKSQASIQQNPSGTKTAAVVANPVSKSQASIQQNPSGTKNPTVVLTKLDFKNQASILRNPSGTKTPTAVPTKVVSKSQASILQNPSGTKMPTAVPTKVVSKSQASKLQNPSGTKNPTVVLTKLDSKSQASKLQNPSGTKNPTVVLTKLDSKSQASIRQNPSGTKMLTVVLTKLDSKSQASIQQNPSGTKMAAVVANRVSKSQASILQIPPGTKTLTAVPTKLVSKSQALIQQNPSGTKKAAVVANPVSKSQASILQNPSGTKMPTAVPTKVVSKSQASIQQNPSGTKMAAVVANRVSKSQASILRNPSGTKMPTAVPTKLVSKNPASMLQRSSAAKKVPTMIRAFPASVTVTRPSDSCTTAATTTTPMVVSAAPAIPAQGKGLMGTKVVPAGATSAAPSVFARNPPASISIMKANCEEGSGSVHIFTKDTPVAMDVS